MRDASDDLSPFLYPNVGRPPGFVKGRVDAFDPYTRLASVELPGAPIATGVPVVHSGPAELAVGDIVMLARTSGGVFILGAVGDGTGPLATASEYSQDPAQTIPNAADTPVQFNTVNTGSSLLTRSVHDFVGHKFTVERTGCWSITCTLRYFGWVGEAYASISHVTLGTLAANGISANNKASTLNIALTRDFVAGDAFFINTFQDSGSSRDIWNAPGWARLNAAWLRY